MLLKMMRFCLDSKQQFNDRVKDFDLTFSQWQVLKVINLSESKELTINEIVSILKSDKATVSLLVKKLKNKQMIESLIKKGDKRKVYLRLTNQMKARCLELKEVEEKFSKDLFINLDEKEVEMLSKLFDKI